MEIITKQKAIENGSMYYFTSKPCKYGHVDVRFVKSGICKSCQRERNNRYYHSDLNHYRSKSRESYIRNKEASLACSKAWAYRNKSRMLEIKKKYRDSHKEKIAMYNSAYNKGKRLDIFFRNSKRLSKLVWYCLRNDTQTPSFTLRLNFTLSELKSHLESRFYGGMTWLNYGSYWHIDHIYPLSKIDLDFSFEDAWSLSNLQPLTAFDNLSKSNKIGFNNKNDKNDK